MEHLPHPSPVQIEHLPHPSPPPNGTFFLIPPHQMEDLPDPFPPPNGTSSSSFPPPPSPLSFQNIFPLISRYLSPGNNPIFKFL